MIQTENFIQQQIVLWFNNTYCLIHHDPRCIILSIPNGGGRDSREGKTLKNTGLLPGASDLLIVLPNATLYIEVKTDIGIQSKEQKDFQQRIEVLGHKYYLVRSLEQFKQIFHISNS